MVIVEGWKRVIDEIVTPRQSYEYQVDTREAQRLALLRALVRREIEREGLRAQA